MAISSVLVCVTGQKMSERLIHRGAEIAREQGMPLRVLMVAGTGRNLLGDPQVAAAMDHLYRISAQSGAEMTVLTSERPQDAITDFAKANGAVHLVIGEGRPDARGMSFAGRLAQALPGIKLHTEPVP